MYDTHYVIRYVLYDRADARIESEQINPKP